MGRPKKYESEEDDNDSYGSIIAASDEEHAFGEEDGSFVPLSGSSSSSSSFVSDNEEDDFEVSSDDESEEMDSEPTDTKIKPSTVIDMFAAANPAQYIKKNVPKEQQMELLNILTQSSDKVASFPEHAAYGTIKCVAVEVKQNRLVIYKNARNKPSDMDLNQSHDPSEVVAFLVLNNFKQIVKTWRKNLGDDVLYTQLQTALSVI